MDNGIHTLLHCPSWDAERRNMFAALGLDLDLDREYARVIEAIMGSSLAFARFCEAVMRAKEEARETARGIGRPGWYIRLCLHLSRGTLTTRSGWYEYFL